MNIRINCEFCVRVESRLGPDPEFGANGLFRASSRQLVAGFDYTHRQTTEVH